MINRDSIYNIRNTINIKVPMGKTTIDSIDSKGRPYCVDIKFIRNPKISSNILPLANKGGSRVSKVLEYICKTVHYGSCFIDIDRIELGAKYNISKSDISIAIKYLVNARAIYPAIDMKGVVEEEKDITSKTYFVNPNLIFYGNATKLAEEIDRRINESYSSIKTGEPLDFTLKIE